MAVAGGQRRVHTVIPDRLSYVALRHRPRDTSKEHYFCVDSQLVYWAFFLDFVRRRSAVQGGLAQHAVAGKLAAPAATCVRTFAAVPFPTGPLELRAGAWCWRAGGVPALLAPLQVQAVLGHVQCSSLAV